MSNFICILTGPAGAGKSTLANMLCEQYPKTARVNVDDLRWSVVNGKLPPYIKTEDSLKQLGLSIKNATALAKNFVDAGFNVFLDDVLELKSDLDLYLELLSGYKVFLFLLMPNKDILTSRDLERPEDEQMGARALELHDIFSQKTDENRWIKIDSSDQSKEETMKVIMDYLKE